MANRRRYILKIALASGSLATATFLAGKYYERHNLSQKVNIPARPALPIFGPSFSVGTETEPEPFLSSLENTWNFGKRLLLQDFGSIKAASPISENVPAYQNTNATRISQIMKHGFPSLENVVSYSDYVLSYDKRNRVAHWVFEHLTEESVRKNEEVDRSKCNFMEDEHIHPYFRSYNKDYKGSGYDRGHLAAAGNHKTCQKHVAETFYLTNMAPQVGKGFNRDSWNRLEKYVRKLTKTYPNVYCCTGPLYLPKREANGKMYVKYEVIGANHVAVPTHFFKVLVGETQDKKLEMECYVMENTVIDDAISLKSFQVPLQVIEKAAGLIFLDNVSKSQICKVNGKTV